MYGPLKYLPTQAPWLVPWPLLEGRVAEGNRMLQGEKNSLPVNFGPLSRRSPFNTP